MYLYILTSDLARYEAEGWRFVCHLRPLGGWEQVLIERLDSAGDRVYGGGIKYARGATCAAITRN